MIVNGTECSLSTLFQRLSSTACKAFPVVSLVQQLVQSPLNCVDVNHQRGIEMVVGHLAKLGHERIGFLTRL